jgi:nucleoside-triphosphatase THEP1
LDIKPFASRLLILTGERGSGKTVLCSRLVEAARKSGWQVSGLVTPAVFEGGQKTAIDVMDLASGARRLLARVRREGDTDIHTIHWTFDNQALDWGNRILEGSVPCNLLVVDELGPLELLRKQGWTAALDALASALFDLAVVVIRPELIEVARSLWPQAVEIVVKSPTQAAALADQIRIEHGMI